jgi:hypothetical protein
VHRTSMLPEFSSLATPSWSSQRAPTRSRLTCRAALLSGFLALILVASGCGMGPYWSSSLALPRVEESLAGRKIVVSNFYATTRTTSTTGSGQILTVMEAANLNDISAEVAGYLQAQGIQAEARKDFGRQDLRSDELLMSGSIKLIDDYLAPISWGHCAVFIVSLTTIGGILPSPLPVENGKYLDYDLQLVDSQGRILANASPRRATGTYRGHWFWSLDSWTPDELLREAKRAYFEQIGTFVKEGLALAGSTPPSKAGEPSDDESVEISAVAASDPLLRRAHEASAAGKHREAIALANDALVGAERSLGPDAPAIEDYLLCLHLFYTMGFMSAEISAKEMLDHEPHLRRLYLLRAKLYGRDHASTTWAKQMIGSLFGEEGLQRAGIGY